MGRRGCNFAAESPFPPRTESGCSLKSSLTPIISALPHPTHSSISSEQPCFSPQALILPPGQCFCPSRARSLVKCGAVVADLIKPNERVHMDSGLIMPSIFTFDFHCFPVTFVLV